MSIGFSRRGFLTALGAAALPGAALASAPARSLRPVARPGAVLQATQPSAQALVARARLDGAVAYAVCDLQSGEMLERADVDAGLPPASVAKALTASYALDALGPGHHFVTRVLAAGTVSEGVLKGDLILAGGADPTLDTDGLATLAQAVKAAGITRITGSLRVWDAALPFERLIDPGQPDHVAYNPALSGINLNFNRVRFEWRRAGDGYAVTMDAQAAAYAPKVRIARMQVAARSFPVYTYEEVDGRDEWTVARGALGNGGSRWLPVRNPARYAGEIFQTLCAAEGVALPDPVQSATAPDGRVLAERKSAPLRVILRDMLRYSTNLTAEVVGMAASAARLGRPPESLRASAEAMNRWAGESFGIGSAALVDHSGLGDASRITAGDMVIALRALRQRQGLKALLKPFPMRDADYRVLQNHPLDVSAKTGTLNFVSGLAGYVDTPNGQELVFAVFAADLERRAALTREQRERPDGARSWNRRAKMLQQALIERWATVYAA